ncbi:anti-sigma-K factor RskA [Sphingomonas sp. BE138]|uniref:anti-sigma factor n=1 Tax=Sphingomonas sp. BE138 TaxID=2817845 RepID=UPI00285964E9|nr:anti-sigma factor [Sphingomonas sp. BE138]MDR6787884.1 anti-sigma-K factor RskA [Sphingomonas sp. BE138]
MTPDDRILAAELVLGLLPDDERARAEARRVQDAAFADEVAWWEARFAGLFDRYREVTPPAHLAARIEAMIDLPRIAPRRRGVDWRSAGIGAALGALAASGAAWLLVPPARVASPPLSPPVQAPRATPVLVAQLDWSERRATPAPVAIVRPEARTVRLAGAVSVPDGRVAELWRLPPGGKPVSLGVIATDGVRTIALAAANVPRAGNSLAISVEPRGGSPTGQPTGPVIAAGALAAL